MLPIGEWRHPVGISGKLSDTPQISAQHNPSSHLASKRPRLQGRSFGNTQVLLSSAKRHKALLVRNTLLYISLIHEI